MKRNNYKTITIGTQTWFAENLRATKYNDGSTLLDVDTIRWYEISYGAVCTYNNTTNADTIKTYGRLYNWYAVNTGKLCPTGWHVPSTKEWSTLVNYLRANGYSYDSSTTSDKIAKALASTTGWEQEYVGGSIGNNPSINNKSGFTALPGGKREDNTECYDGCNFGFFGSSGFWWTSTGSSTEMANYISLASNYDFLFDNELNYKVNGYSVRCLKD